MHAERVRFAHSSASSTIPRRAPSHGLLRRQRLAESASPRARAVPISRGRKEVPPESGMSPILAKACTKLADFAATTISQASAILAPAPATTPLTAQTTGHRELAQARSTSGR